MSLIKILSAFAVSALLASAAHALSFGEIGNLFQKSETATAADQKDFGHPGYENIEARVTRVADGDTLTVREKGSNNKIKIRLLGIDAPELKMEGGNASRRHLENLIRSGNNQVRIYYLSKKKFDRYGRIIGKVVTNNIDVNRQMVLDGHAWFYRNYQKDVMPKDRVLYQEAMYEAQRTKRGLWAQPNPLEPWEWRKTHRRKD